MKSISIFLLCTLLVIFSPHLNAQSAGDSSLNSKTVISSRDIELQRDRLLLIEATIELNEVLLLGIKASLDSLNVEDENTDPKNAQAEVHKLQRLRDKVLLTPEFLHMQDSLTTDITILKKQKSEIETSLLASIQKPTAKNKTQPVALNETKKGTSPGKNDDVATKTKREEKRHSKLQSVSDTLIVSDVYKPGANNNELTPSASKTKKNEKGHAQVMAPDNVVVLKDSSLNPLIPEKPIYTLAVALPEDTTLLNLKASEQQYFDDSINIIRAEYFLTRARKSINEKNYKQAEDYLKKALAQQSDYYDARLARAELEVLTGQNEKALADYKLCLNDRYPNAKILYNIGEVLLSLKKNGEAASYFERSLKMDSNFVPAMIVRAGFLSEHRQYTEAIAIYNRVLILNVSYHIAYKGRGIAEFGKKEYTAAIGDLTRYLIFKENDAETYYYRGLARVEREETANACLDFNAALHLGYNAAKNAIDKNCGK